MRKFNKKFILSLLLGLFLFFTLTSNFFFKNYEETYEKKKDEYDNEINVKLSGFWEINFPIVIDEQKIIGGSINWSEAVATFPFCDGNGIQNDPYIIQNYCCTNRI